MATVFLGIGSNLGDRIANIGITLNMLVGTEDIKPIALSPLYETQPIDVADQPNFVNCVGKFSTTIKPQALLMILKAIEERVGRTPNSHLKPRTMDIDILLYDNEIIDSHDLSIPHPRMSSRRFVIEPLIEIEPNAIDPMSSLPLAGFLERVSNQGVIKIADSKEVADVRRLFA